MSCTATSRDPPGLTQTDRMMQPTSSRTTPGTPTPRRRTRRKTRRATSEVRTGRTACHFFERLPRGAGRERGCIIAQQPTSIELLTPGPMCSEAVESGRLDTDGPPDLTGDGRPARPCLAGQSRTCPVGLGIGQPTNTGWRPRSTALPANMLFAACYRHPPSCSPLMWMFSLWHRWMD